MTRTTVTDVFYYCRSWFSWLCALFLWCYHSRLSINIRRDIILSKSLQPKSHPKSESRPICKHKSIAQVKKQMYTQPINDRWAGDLFFFSPEGLSCRSRWRTGQRANFGQFMWRPQQRLPSSESHRTKRGRCLLSLVRLYFLLSRRKTDQNFFFSASCSRARRWNSSAKLCPFWKLTTRCPKWPDMKTITSHTIPPSSTPSREVESLFTIIAPKGQLKKWKTWN